MDAVKDIVPELLESIKSDYSNEIKTNEKIKALMNISTKTNYSDANSYSQEIGQALVDAYNKNITVDSLPDGKMYFNIADRTLNPTMKEAYEDISNFAVDVQSKLNEMAGINIKGIASELNQDRIDGIVNKMSESDNFEDVAWLLDEPIKNFCQSIVDDTVKKNIEFHHSLGLSPKITRKEAGNCCDWCKQIVGTYKYPNEVPADIYRRHRYCRCEVSYDPGDGSKKKQDIWSKKWKEQEESAKVEERKLINTLPKTARLDDISTENFARGSGKNYPIKFTGSNHVKFNSKFVEKVTVIAGDGVTTTLRDSHILETEFHEPKKRWKKISGETNILFNSKNIKAEIHWYEANSKRKLIKVKRVFENES